MHRSFSGTMQLRKPGMTKQLHFTAIPIHMPVFTLIKKQTIQTLDHTPF